VLGLAATLAVIVPGVLGVVAVTAG